MKMEYFLTGALFLIVLLMVYTALYNNVGSEVRDGVSTGQYGETNMFIVYRNKKIKVYEKIKPNKEFE